MANISEEDKKRVDDLCRERREHVELSAPELKREDFESDEAYRGALVEQYRALRMDEYGVEVRRQTLEMYTASRTHGNINHDIWVKPLDNSMPADSCVMTAYQRQPILNPNGPDNQYRHNQKIASCAKTAVCVVGQVSDNLGYNGSDNIAAGTGGGSLASAAGVHEGLADKKYKKEGTLKDLVSSGEIGPGSIVSVPSPGNGGSNMHAMVLADVVRDKNNNVVGYYLQGNNGTSFTYHDINEKNSRNTQKVTCTATNVWMGERINNEIEGKSPEELQAMIADTKGRMLEPGGRLDKLSNAEEMMLTPERNPTRSITTAMNGFRNHCDLELSEMKRENYQLYREAHPIAPLEVDITAGMKLTEITPDEITIRSPQPDVLMGAKAPKKKKVEAPTVEVETPAPAPEVETAPAATERPAVMSMFTQIDEAGWQQLTGAYLSSVNKEAPVADVMREDAARVAASEEVPSLVEGLSAEAPVNEAAVKDERPALVTALTDDKSFADGLFGSLMTALTTNDDKNLDDSMKLALNLFTSFMEGVDKEGADSVPSLADFMDYLSEGKDKTPEQSNEQGRATLHTLNGMPLYTTMSIGGR